MIQVGFAADVAYRLLGTIKTDSPAFVSVEKFHGTTDQEFLLISEFGAFSSGKVAVIPNIKDAFTGKTQIANLKSQVLSD